MKKYYEVVETNIGNDDEVIHYGGFKLEDAKERYDMAERYLRKGIDTLELREWELDDSRFSLDNEDSIVDAMCYSLGYDAIRKVER